MGQKEFKVGQVWRRRNGGTETIRAVLNDDCTTYLVTGSSGCVCTRTGDYRLRGASGSDLVELVQDAPPPAPPAKEFKVGQVWKRRDGGIEKIAGNCDEECVTFSVWTASGATYTAAGSYNGWAAHPADLVELVQDAPEKPAPPPSPFGTLSAVARVAIESAIVELQGQAAHAASERDAALRRFEEAAERQREKELAAIELGTLLVRMPESTD